MIMEKWRRQENLGNKKANKKANKITQEAQASVDATPEAATEDLGNNKAKGL